MQGNLSPDLLEQAMDDMEKARSNFPCVRAITVSHQFKKLEAQGEVAAPGMV